MSKRKFYLLCFIIPIFLLFIVSSLCGYIPLGPYTFNIFDSFNEYPTFLVELGNMLRSGRSIFYTLHAGLGVNFFSILNLYGGSPLNLFSVFFDNTNIYIFYAILIYLKIGLSGLTMGIYLNSLNTKFKNTIWNVVFSLIYAFSGWAMAMNMHIMWLDAYILLPLIIKGLDKLILENKYLEYTLFLAIAIIINYYTGFMLCIFMVIYFLYKSLTTNNFNKRTILRFIIFSLTAALLSCVILIPTYFNLMTGRLSNLNFSFNYLTIDWFQLLSSIYNMSIGSFIIEDHFTYGSTTLYISIFALVLLICYFLNKKIPRKNKLITFFIILFFHLSFSIPLIDYIWNLFQQPKWWEHRYQFVYIFFTLIIAYESFCKSDSIEISTKKKSIITLIFMILLIGSFSYKVMGLELSNLKVLMAFLSIILFYIYLRLPKQNKWLILLIILELSINGYATLYTNRGFKYEVITSDNIDFNQMLDNIEEKDYRIIDKNYPDAGLMFGFNSIQIFSSSYNMQVANFLKELNVIIPSANTIMLKSYNPAVLSLLGLKYMITGDSNYFPCEDNICINPYALPLMYAVNDNILKVNMTDNAKENINNIYSALLGEETNLFDEPKINTYLENVEIEEDSLDKKEDNVKIVISTTVDKKSLIIPNNITLLMEKEWGTTTITINEEPYSISTKSDYLITLNARDTISITYTYNEESGTLESLEDHLFTVLDLEAYERSIKKIQETTNYKNIDDNDYILKGEVEVNNDLLLITIPYDEGLNIKIDGKEVDYFKVLDTFVGIEANKGKHTVEITYFPKGLKIGSIISMVSLVSLLIYTKMHKRRKK